MEFMWNLVEGLGLEEDFEREVVQMIIQEDEAPEVRLGEVCLNRFYMIHI